MQKPDCITKTDKEVDHMKKYEEPKLDVIILEDNDIVTNSDKYVKNTDPNGLPIATK